MPPFTEPKPTGAVRDTPAPQRRATVLLGVATLLAGSSTYIGAVSLAGWLIFVLPPILVAAFFGWRVGRRSGFWSGWLAGLLFAFGLAVLIKISGYNQGGSVARSPLFAGILGAGAIAALARSQVATFAGLIAGVVVAGWTITGSVYHPISAAITVGLVVITLTVEEGRRRVWNPKPSRFPPWFAAILTSAVATATAVALIPPPPPDPEHKPTPIPTPPPSNGSLVLGLSVNPRVLILILILLALLIAILIGRLRHSMRANRLRRSLAGGEPAQSVANAWAWTITTVRQRGVQLPNSLSPDTASQCVEPRLDAARSQFLELAALAQEAAFVATPRTGPTQVTQAWELADQVVTGTAKKLPIRIRVGGVLGLSGRRAS